MPNEIFKDIKNDTELVNKISKEFEYAQCLFEILSFGVFAKNSIDILASRGETINWKMAGKFISEIHKGTTYVSWIANSNRYFEGVDIHDSSCMSSREFNEYHQTRLVNLNPVNVPLFLLEIEVKEDLKRLGWVIVGDKVHNGKK